MKRTEERMRGITLVALVVTIVVILILAGIAIGTVVGKNGIIRKVQEAIEMSKNHADEEQEEIDKIINKSDKIGTGDCDMAIKVKLVSYNESLGSFPVVFQVTAVSDAKRIYNDVISINLSSPGEQTLELIGMGPEGTVVTVTQIYGGKNYQLTSPATVALTLSTNKKEIANFEQGYNGGSILVNSLSNKLEYDKAQDTHKLVEGV